jgi:hypothetical protein
VYVLKAFGPPELTEARAKVVDSFRRKKNVNLADVRKKLKGAVEYDPTDDELQEIIKTVANRESDFSWTFKESPKNP